LGLMPKVSQVHRFHGPQAKRSGQPYFLIIKLHYF
jgi:hypothetical protein